MNSEKSETPIEPHHLDDAIRSAILRSPTPENLRESILSQAKAGKKPNNLIRFWLPRVATAAIVVFGLLLAVNFTLMKGNRSLNSERSFAAASISYIENDRFLLDLTSSDLGKISEHLALSDELLESAVPDKLFAKELLGCKQLEWQASPVSLICFHLEDGAIAHLFIKKIHSEDVIGEEAVETYLADKLPVRSWTHEDRVFVLVGSEPDVDLDSLV